MSRSEDWMERHARAVARPNPVEQPIVTILQQMGGLVARHGEDQVLREGLALILQGVRVLLDGNIGRLDAGTVDEAISGLMEAMDFDPDTGEFR
jgi:hypothetical protein